MGLKLYTIFIYNVSFLKVRFGGQKWGGGGGGGGERSNKGKERRKKKERGEGKEEKRKKAMVALLVFIMATWRKLLDGKGPFGYNVSKYPAT